MKRVRRWSVLSVPLLASLLAGTALGAEAPPPAASKAEGEPPTEKWLLDRSLTISPAPAPVPVFQMRLFPLSSTLKDGNAVPIYLRLVFEQNDAARRRWSEVPSAWNELPLDKLPVAEAREFLAGYGRFFQQIDLGARRKDAEWNYTIDQGSVIDILLPDVQSMRSYVPLLVLRARVAIAEGNFAAAAHALETGFAFSRHVAHAPFLINGLVGIACASQFEDAILEFISRADAPNLYWALTALPRPLIDLRESCEFEQRFLEMQFPYLTDLDQSRTPEQWDALLKKFRTECQRWQTDKENKPLPQPPGTAPADAAEKSPDLATARKYLVERAGMPADQVGAMPPAQVILVWVVRSYTDYRDDRYKAVYLPFPEGRPLLADADHRLKNAPDSEARRLADWILAALIKVKGAENRADRKLAALRTIEALRMYAAAHDGQLPDRLSDIKEVPMPADPGTGRPFEYQRKGETATLSGRIPGEPLEITGLRYHLTVRHR